MSFISERDRMRHMAQELLDQDPVFLDTETTGISPDDEVVEICVLDAGGEVLVDTLVKPLGEVHPEAVRHHGITETMLAGAPSWPKVWPQVEASIGEARVAIYNAEFDVRMMRQSHQKYGMTWTLDDDRFDCIMHLYAEFYGEWDRRRETFRWQKLEAAARQSGILLRNTHRARDDAMLTRAVLRFMAGFTD
jgi:DNA polymerase-3 subunit epsilon